MRLKYLKFTKMFENVLKKLINSYLNFKKKKMALPLMKKKTLIEKKISENAQQNQTHDDTGEAGRENWPLRKLYIPESELT